MSQHTSRKSPRKPKKFRFLCVANFLENSLANKKLRIADIAGGNGLLSAILVEKGFSSVVIDPQLLSVPHAFKDLQRNKKVILEDSKILRITQPFSENLAKEFDILVSLHGHGVMRKILTYAQKYDKKFLILPCCVIDEPIQKASGINWTESLENYACELHGRENIHTGNLGFMGKDTYLTNL